MKLTSDPAYKTSTGPEPVGDADADAELVAPDAGELDELAELEELLDELQPAAASARKTSPSTALRETNREFITGRPYQSGSNRRTSWIPNCNSTDRHRLWRG
jgi:hypothetical protein